MSELQLFIRVRVAAELRKDQFQFVTSFDHTPGTYFGTNRKPVDTCGGRERAICLDCDFKLQQMKCIHKRLVNLEERFPTGAYHEALM